MPYPRRRAPIACEYCRHRKRRCDGRTPVCSLCATAGVECKYLDKPPEVRKARRPDNSGTAALLQRINELENRLRECQRNEAERSASSPSRSSTHEPTSCLGDDLATSTEEDRNTDPFQVDDGVAQTGGSATGTPNAQIGVLQDALTGMSGDNDPPIAREAVTPQTSTLGLSPSIWAAQPLPMSDWLQLGSASALNYGPSSIPTTDEGVYVIIPSGHHTTTSSLLSIEPVRALVGYYPEGLFYDLEASREASRVIPCDMMSDDLSLLLSQVDLRQETTDRLISDFFAFIHPQFPILNSDLFPEVFEKSKQDVSKHIYGPSLGMCLLVLALGTLGSTDSPVSPDDNDSAGMPYFIIAYRILTTIWAGSFDDDLCQPTGMLLAAIYLCFKSRPLAAWKLAYMSSCNLQLLTQRTMSGCYDKEHDDMLSRLCWTCFVVECDSLSEFHLPRTGIEMAIDRMNFPRLAASLAISFARVYMYSRNKPTILGCYYKRCFHTQFSSLRRSHVPA
ncbi:Citrinin biosynthesis transcriptional activator ctnR [Colletotrichum fructicola]|nr:Citrinin biosynthesis transcriptional activator ctnR [Colletotrichum fructicola]